MSTEEKFKMVQGFQILERDEEGRLEIPRKTNDIGYMYSMFADTYRTQEEALQAIANEPDAVVGTTYLVVPLIEKRYDWE